MQADDSKRGVWCGVVWCGVVWCGVLWCAVLGCGVFVGLCLSFVVCFKSRAVNPFEFFNDSIQQIEMEKMRKSEGDLEKKKFVFVGVCKLFMLSVVICSSTLGLAR